MRNEVCSACGLAFGKSEHADGPIFFVITFFGMLVTAIAGLVEYAYAPPLWLHAALWVPLIMFGSIYSLRFFGAMLTSVQYRHRLHGFEDES